MNKAILIGRLCADPELRTTTSGAAVSTYRLAVDRPIKTEGQPEADFLSVVAWSKAAEFAGKYFRKGMKIAVEGRLQTRSYEDKEGRKIFVTEIVAERQEFCEKKDSGAAPVPTTDPGFTEISGDDDLPF